jgi:hypothetical protein
LEVRGFAWRKSQGVFLLNMRGGMLNYRAGFSLDTVQMGCMHEFREDR